MTLREMQNILWESLFSIDEPSMILKAVITYYIFVDLEEVDPPITNFNDLHKETIKKLDHVAQTIVPKYSGKNEELKKERFNTEEQRLMTIECLENMIRAIQPHISPGI